MQKHLYRFPCPCCGKNIEVDTRTEKARAVKADEAKGGTDLDQLLAQEQRHSERLGSAFDSARQRQREQAKHLDELLDRAKDDARSNPDEQIKRPFDLD